MSQDVYTMPISEEQIAEIEALYSECGAKGRVAIPCSTIESLISRLRAAEMDAERMRAERNDFRDSLNNLIDASSGYLIEIANLREALEEIRHANMNGPVSESNAGCIKRIEQIAERALTESTGQEVKP